MLLSRGSRVAAWLQNDQAALPFDQPYGATLAAFQLLLSLQTPASMLLTSLIVCLSLFLRESHAADLFKKPNMHVGRPKGVLKTSQRDIPIARSVLPKSRLDRPPHLDNSKLPVAKGRMLRRAAASGPFRSHHLIEAAQKTVRPFCLSASPNGNQCVENAIKALEHLRIPGASVNSYPLLLDGTQYDQSTATVDDMGTAFFAGKSISVSIQEGDFSDNSVKKAIEVDADGIIIGIKDTRVYTFEFPDKESDSRQPTIFSDENESSAASYPTTISRSKPKAIVSPNSFKLKRAVAKSKRSAGKRSSSEPLPLPKREKLDDPPTSAPLLSSIRPSSSLRNRASQRTARTGAMLTSPTTPSASHTLCDALGSVQCSIL